jgi:site-specific DNA-methyltransferase (adenine-specific)
MSLMARYPDKHFDLAIVDPPYFSGPDKLGYYGARISSSGVKRDGYSEIGVWTLPDSKYFSELYRVSKNQIIWGCNYYEKHINTPGRIVWDKVNYASSFSDAEIASCSFHDSVRMFSYMWNGMLQGKNAIQGKVMQGNKKLNEKRIHPTQKPVELYRWILEKYAKPGYQILDTHLGSGSIAIACHDYGFDFTGCELDTYYFNSAMKRIKQHTDQQSLFQSA